MDLGPRILAGVMEIRQTRLANGLTLVVEEHPGKPGVAFGFLIPAGATTDPEGFEGAAAVLERWLWKGAGTHDARGFAHALDALGVRRGSSAGLEYTTFSAAMLAENFAPALRLFADLLVRPWLDAASFAASVKSVEEELAGLEDNPPRKLFTRLRAEVFSSPHRRNVEGSFESLARLDHEAVRASFARRYGPKGAILAVAGGVTFDEVLDWVTEILGDWRGAPSSLPAPSLTRPHAKHWPEETAQVQIGLYYRDVPPGHPDFYVARLAAQVLSGGMSSRLFTEIREKRGLVYSVHASPGSVKGWGYLAAYAGTTPERAQATLGLLKEEIARLAAGVSGEELERAKIGVKSALVMQGESARARVGALVRDVFLFGRPRTLSEMQREVEAVDLERMNAFLARHPYDEPWEGVLGPLEVAS